MNKKIGIAADHGGFELKEKIKFSLSKMDYEVIDFGAVVYNKDDDYPDLIIPLAKAVSKGEVTKGLAICGSGVGACVTANKIKGVRAAMAFDPFSARQGVEDDDVNIVCLGGNIVGFSLAMELIKIFLSAKFKFEERFIRRLKKITDLEG